MTLSPIVAEWAAAYAQETGKQPCEKSLQLAEGIMAVKEMFEEQGRKDARDGSATYSASVSSALAAAALRMDPARDQEPIQAVADLWYSGYMDGYKT